MLTAPERHRSESASAPSTPADSLEPWRVRPAVRGPFLELDGRGLYVKGVTYGTFAPAADGLLFPPREVVEQDLEAMAARGFNAVRVYTPPPVWMLDTAASLGIGLMVGIPWAQHVAFLDQGMQPQIRAKVRETVRRYRDHSGILCYAVGNEIPASIVRWHGARRIQRFIHGLYDAAKQEDPDALVTYVNYPTTEYLDLPFLDLLLFNVFLESRPALRKYLARLHNLANDRPLLLGEVGLDGLRHGDAAQAESLDWQLRTAFESGCAGVFVFAWTDEWYRGGREILDWQFGLTRRDRTPKPVLSTVHRTLAETPLRPRATLPKVSVVVCTHNGAATLAETLERIRDLDYPDYEVIVVDDGSTDATADIVARYAVRSISTENKGLSSARNTGLQAAEGEIVAYLDDDAYPDALWLRYLAHAFEEQDWACVGGPNLPPESDPPLAHAVANSPGGPVHVLLTDQEAEHVPGCNMAFRRDRLLEIGGFDPRFRTAGDDVDVCWRIQQHGWKVGYHPGALVWHHRRPSAGTYLRQQVGYGRAEAMLEDKWPSKYNAVGHLSWEGRIYGRGAARALVRPQRVYHGLWGEAPYQSLYERTPGTWWTLPLMPEWYLLLGVLLGLSVMGLVWPPFLVAAPMLVAGVAASIAQAANGAIRARAPEQTDARSRIWYRLLVGGLHLLQPMARLRGRLGEGLTIWRRRGLGGWSWLSSSERALWSEQWHSAARWIESLERRLTTDRVPVLRPGPYEGWDLEVRGGLLGRIRVLTATEEHADGRQLVRFRLSPRVRAIPLLSLTVMAGVLAFPTPGDSWLPSALFLVGAVLFVALAMLEVGGAEATVYDGVSRVAEEFGALVIGEPTSPGGDVDREWQEALATAGSSSLGYPAWETTGRGPAAPSPYQGGRGPGESTAPPPVMGSESQGGSRGGTDGSRPHLA